MDREVPEKSSLLPPSLSPLTPDKTRIESAEESKIDRDMSKDKGQGRMGMDMSVGKGKTEKEKRGPCSRARKSVESTRVGLMTSDSPGTRLSRRSLSLERPQSTLPFFFK
ncbi:hypothetical protein GYMLUDRAFT_34804 [Collybiopsis luxurians FD-317 M1]|nr:hypothetical protein GYMLUDRAFT_34804 [Collybiopsis luxurians FD-317 M1]